ncbi:hypothetical protein [Frigidibacter sp. ROC022]|uniref:hypothetical protein n=1 Tax=Frigidibacter sp. ROC022 TaxID=2971796 RepID=UPI00215B5CEF|nr:hypothetical protein [Frigidibacter sp. ROC022]MCR8725436.1 hypothetical protein [Frigidibacter sp. ROC022]
MSFPRTAARLLAPLCLSLAAALPAAAFTAENGLVVSSNGGVISVPFRGKSGATDFWCAAGDYVIRGLHMAPTTRVWRLSEPPRGSGEGIDFALSPDGAASSTGLAKLGGDPASLTAAHAQSFCKRGRILWDWD